MRESFWTRLREYQGSTYILVPDIVAQRLKEKHPEYWEPASTMGPRKPAFKVEVEL